MRIFLLGPVRVRADDATPIDVGGVRLRMLLARLALEAGRPVSVDALVDGLWGVRGAVSGRRPAPVLPGSPGSPGGRG